MSTWRIAIRALHQLGGEATVRTVGDVTLMTESSARLGLTEAAKLGLATGPGYSFNRKVMRKFQITQLGVDFCENRIAQVEMRPGGRRWVATWLSSLPRGLRLADQREAEPA